MVPNRGLGARRDRAFQQPHDGAGYVLGGGALGVLWCDGFF